MQNRYVPDLGDFSKFGVIHALAEPGAAGGLRTGLVWYLVDLGETNNDGRHVTYLDLAGTRRDRFRACDPRLYDRMGALRRSGARHVAAYRQREVGGPAGTVVYFEDLLDFADLRGRAARGARREAWLARAAAAVRDCDMVLLDPDNGLEIASVHPLSPRGVKYATLEECAWLFHDARRSLVVYQHTSRQGSVARQAEVALRRLAAALDAPRARCFALRFHRGTSRLYLVAPAAPHAALLRARAEAMVAGPWGRNGHFSLVA